MRTTKDERERWRLEVMPEPEKLPMGPIHGSHIRQLYERQNRLIADVDEATRLLGLVLAEMPSMRWLIEQGGLSTENAPRFAQRIGDAYVFLEEPSQGATS